MQTYDASFLKVMTGGLIKNLLNWIFVVWLNASQEMLKMFDAHSLTKNWLHPLHWWISQHLTHIFRVFDEQKGFY